MATEQQVQDPATLGEVSVSVTEETEFPLDSSLLALSGNDMQHYCTMLSLLEFQNIKPLMFLRTEQGEMPLPLVTVVEDFEVGPWLYEGNESVPFDLPQQGSPGPQVQIQYNFVLHSEGDILQGSPSRCWTASGPEQGTDLQTSEEESMASGENLSMLSQTLMGNSTTAFQHQEGFCQPNEMDLTAGQGNPGLASEQNDSQNVSGLDLCLGHDLRTGGPCGDRGVGEISIHQEERSPSSNSSVSSASEPLPSVVLERSPTEKTLCLCPNCGRVFNLMENPVAHQLPPTSETLYKCPTCGYLFMCGSPGSAEDHQVTLTDDWEGLLCQLDLNHRPDAKAGGLQKRFHCPDCGRGFVHKSSIPRHQKLHRKDNLLQNSGQEKSCGPARNQLGTPKALSGKRPLSCPNGRSRSAGKERGQLAALCEVCGQSFSPGFKFQRHLATHSHERPFCCSHCGKAFAVKSVLIRHLLLHQPKKPFQCRYCDKSYIQKCHLSRHCQTNHRSYE